MTISICVEILSRELALGVRKLGGNLELGIQIWEYVSIYVSI